MARKMGRNLKKAAAGLMACAAIALCAVSPAWGAERASDVVNVTVPTRIECALGADGTVTAPGGLEVVNNGPQDLYVGASTVDDFGQKVEFAMDLGGSPLLSRAGGKDVEGEVEFAGSSRKGLGLAVSKLNRTSHAALMDAAAQGEAPMFTVGFKFTFKALQGSMSISGEAKLGKTLTAAVSGAQADAKLAYRWYRDGQLIAGAESASYTANEADQGKKLKCEAYDAAGRYVGGVSAEVGPVKGPEAFAVFSADDGSLNFYKRVDVPKAGEQFEGKTVTEVYTGVETYDYGSDADDNLQSSTNPKWLIHAAEIQSVAIVDKIKPVSCAFWFFSMVQVTSDNLDIANLDTSVCHNMRSMFMNMPELTVLNLRSFNTQSLTNMNNMFDDCYQLHSLDVSSFDTSRVTDMRSVFNDCRSLATLDVSNFDASSVKRTQGMFYSCASLEKLDLSNLITDQAKFANCSRMFEECVNLSELDISGLAINEETNMANIFLNCRSLRTVVRGDKFRCNASKQSYMPTPDSNYIPGADGYWYDEATGDAYLSKDVPSYKAATYIAVNPVKAPTVTIEGRPVFGSTLTAKVSGQPAGTTATSYQWQWSIDGKNWRDSQYESAKTESITLVMNGEFSPENNYYRCVVTTTAGKKRVPQGISGAVGPVGKIGAFAVFSADDNSLSFYNRVGKPAEGSQFDGRTATKVYADIEKTDFISASNALWADKAPVIRTISFRDVVKPNSTKNWFANMTSLERISFANLDMSACSDMSSMFYNCISLSSVDTADVNTASVTSMQNLFENCSKLTALDLSKLRTTSVTNMSRILSGCSSLSDIKLTGLDVSHVEDMSYMFHNCSALTTLDVSGFRTDAAKNMHSMFFGCSNLRELDLSGFDTTNVAYMNLMFKGDIRLQSVRLGSKFAWKGSEQPYLPAPSATYIPGATGKWYSALTGAGHSPQSIPSNWADTYYASKSLAPSVTIPSSKGSVSGSDIVATINNAPGIDPNYEWHHKGNVSGSVTVAAGMSEIRESRFDVLGEVVGTVRILDSNMFRNGVFIEIENIDTNKVVWSEMFVSNSFTDVRIPRGRYIFRVRNTDPVSHEVYFAYSGEVDEVISTMDRVSTTLAEAYRPGDTIICIVNDRKGQYPSMKSNAYTVGVKSNGDIKTPSAHVDVVESVLVSRDEAKEDSVIAPNAAPPYTTDAGANESGRDTVEMSAPGSKSTESDPDAGKPDDSANEKAFMTAQTDTRPHDQGVNSLESAAGSPPEEDGLKGVTSDETQ